MKKSSDWLNVGSAGSEKIGVLLSASLKQSQSGDCLPLEEIAALVEGNVEKNDRDRIMNHLATCDRCYDVFLLASGLNEQQIIPMKRTFFSHPVRLAASVIIAAFSLFLFYKIVFIPGISDKPDLKIEPGKETAAPLMKEGYEAAKREKGRGVLRMVEKREAEKGARDIPAGEPVAEFPRVKTQPGETAKKSGEKKAAIGSLKQQDITAGREIDRQMEEQDLQQFQNAKTREQVRQDVSRQDSQMLQQQTFPQQRQSETEQQAAVQQRQYDRQEKDSLQAKTAVPEKVALGDKRKRGGAHEKSVALPTVSAGIETEPWSTFERLNGELSQYKTYMPEDKIENLFQTAAALAGRLEHELRKQGEKRYAIDGVGIEEVPGKRLVPVMRIESQGGIIFVIPHIRYFLGKSEPGTRAYRFFNLALSGWCDERSCYGEIKGKIEKERREKLLANWQALRPELQGIFLTIADRTINHLRK